MNPKFKGSLKAAVLAAAALSGAVIVAQAANPVPTFAVLERIAGPDGGGWDYTSIDAASRQLYLARGAGALQMDLDTRKITPVAIPGAGLHTAALAGDTGLVFTTNGQKNTVSVFDTKAGKMRGDVKVGDMPDAAVYDPSTKLVAVMNHRGGTVSLVDLTKLALVKTIPVGGELEFAAAAGDGRLFVNVANKHEVAVLDLAAGKVLHRWVMAGCEDPSGLAYDAADQLVASVCGNGVTKFLHAADGTEAASLKTGNGSDGLIYDAARALLFVPAGEDGTLAVVTLGKTPAVVQVLKTASGARLGALDAKTGRVYLPAAKDGPPAPSQRWPSIVKGSFGFLVVGAH
jgi:DNA-binding beta-propeller fold protein YncE